MFSYVDEFRVLKSGGSSTCKRYRDPKKKKKGKGKTIYFKNGDSVCPSICIGPFSGLLARVKAVQHAVTQFVKNDKEGEQS